MGTLSRFDVKRSERPGRMSHHQRIRYLQASDHVKLAWAETGTGPVLVKASNWLSHLDVRLGESDLEPLAAVFRRPLPVRALRRARVRHERLERRQPVVQSAARRSRGRDRGRGDPRTVRLARHLARRGHLHRVCDPLPRTRVRASCSTAGTHKAVLTGTGTIRSRTGFFQALVDVYPRRLGARQTRPSGKSSRRGSSPGRPTSR